MRMMRRREQGKDGKKFWVDDRGLEAEMVEEEDRSETIRRTHEELQDRRRFTTE